jgi:Uma2 family endonuclease
MATAPTPPVHRNGYPTSDGKPMAETDRHRELMFDLIRTLQGFYAAQPMVYVSGDLLLFYEPGNRRRHVSPDVFVVKGVAKHERLNYLLWEGGMGPDVVIELTSSSTRREDMQGRFRLCQDTLRVKEYFLFDPYGDYLDPPLRGNRLRAGAYVPIRPVRDRLPSRMLGLHLEHVGENLRLYDPITRRWLPTAEERAREAGNLAIEVREQLALAQQTIEVQRQIIQTQAQALEGFNRLEVEVEDLRRELEQLRRQTGSGNSGRR